MKALSLFDGMSGLRIALDKIGVTPSEYYAAEIDKFAIAESKANWEDITHLGDVTKWREWDIPWHEIDLVTGGFPCQAWSMAGKQLGDKDPRGMLFWTMLEIMTYVRFCNPECEFLIENVKMKREFEEYITYHTEQALGEVHKIMIDSALVSAQTRKRYYWTSFPVTQPEDRGILLRDVLEDVPTDPTYMSDNFVERQKGRKCLVDNFDQKASNLSAMEYVKNGRQGDYIRCEPFVDRDKSYSLSASYANGASVDEYLNKHRRQIVFGVPVVTSSGRNNEGKRVLRGECVKSPTLTARYYKGVQSDGAPFVYSGTKSKGDTFDFRTDLHYRKLTVVECCRLQNVPDDYFKVSSNTQAYKMLGNGWNINTIVHILEHIICKILLNSVTRKSA